MSFSKSLRHLNRVDFLKTIDVKQANTIITPDAEHMHTMCSISPLATQKMYTRCKIKEHMNNKKPKSILSLNGYFWINWFDEWMPTIANCVWTVWKIFIVFLQSLFKVWISNKKYSVQSISNLQLNKNRL